MQDGTSDGRYRLLECIGRNDKGETWRAFDNVTQREVAVTVVSEAADDGGDTVAKEIPQWAAGPVPALDYPATGSGYVFEYPAYSPLGSTPAGLPPDEQTPQEDSKAPGPKKSGKRRLIVLSSLGVIRGRRRSCRRGRPDRPRPTRWHATGVVDQCVSRPACQHRSVDWNVHRAHGSGLPGQRSAQ